MPRTPRIVNSIAFLIASIVLCWFLMLAFHELGHVIGAMTSGGVVERVVLHPLTISRTDVHPNPQPLWVVWLGPIVGCLIPLSLWWSVPQQFKFARKLALFFLGFCLIANGAYVGIGAFDSVGDCGTMLKHGSPFWTLVLFGAVTASTGLYAWHSLGPPAQLMNFLGSVDWKTTRWMIVTLFIWLLSASVLSTR